MALRTASSLAAFLLATTGFYAPQAHAQSVDIPLQIISLGTGDYAYQRLIINVGVAGGTPHPYLFDTGSALFNVPQSFVPTTIATLSNNAHYIYGDGNGYQGNLSTVPSISFYTSSSATASSVTLPTSTVGYVVNEVTTHLLSYDSKSNAPTITVHDPNGTGTVYNVDTAYPNGTNGVPPIETAIYGTFGAGDFATIIGNGTAPNTSPATFTPVTVGSILGQSTTSGYVVAANATQSTQTATSCNPCAILGLTPQLRAQFTSFAPWDPTTGIGPNFPTSGANSSTEFGATFTYTATLNGVKVTWTGPSLLDAGTQDLNLHTKTTPDVLAMQTQVSGYLDAGAVVTMTGSAPGAATTVFVAQSAATAPDTYQVNLTSNSNSVNGQNQTPGIAYFLANSVMYDLANQTIGYSPNFVTDANVAQSLTINPSDGPLGLAGAISDGPSGPSTLTLNPCTGGTSPACASALLTGTNTYTGPTSIGTGAQLTVAGPGSISTSSLVTVNGTLDLSGVVVSQLPQPGPSSVTLTGLAGSGQVNVGSQALTLTKATGTFSGTIADGGIYGGTGASLTIAGGTQTLTGVNTYTGGTTITNGATLAVNSDAALGAATAPLTFNNGTLVALGNITSTRPVTVTALGGTVNAGTYQVSFNGMFTALGDLVTIGSVNHAGASNVTGTLTVGDGQTSVDGSLTAANLYVAPTATLRGTGTITANTTVDGTLAPGDSPGTLTHKGKLTLTDRSTTRIDIDGPGTGKGPGNYSRIVVTGGKTFSAAGTLKPILRGITGNATNIYVPPIGKGFGIISADGGVVGSYASLVQPAGLAAGTRFDAPYGPTTISLVVTPGDYANLSAAGISETANQARVGAALDAARPVAGVAMTSAQQALYGPLYTAGAGNIGFTLTQMSPTIAGDNMLAQRDTAGLVATTIGAELEARRGAAPGQQAQSADLPSGGTIWLAGMGQFNHLSTQSAPGYSGSTGGTVVGVDYAPTSGVTGGFALAFANTDLQDSAGARLSTDGLLMTAYGSLRSGPWFVDGQAGGGFFETNTWRPVSITGTSAQGSTGGSSAGATLRAGLHLLADGWQLEPSLLLGGSSIQQNGYTETQGGPTALGVSAGASTSVQTLLGVRVEKSFTVSESMTLVPNARLGWAHEFANPQAGTFGAFTTVSSTPFFSQTASLGRDRAVIGAGASLKVSPATTLFASYDGAIGSQATSQNVTGGVRITF